mmetsp:Transcript_53975/g.152098  ORF Transcript_53975/g.152098 Transcript_53975/m.152098 type:complete len:450 (-) Transcript_53975:165-1514(-)|eukprot:CAMPEP_0179260022 /NCGR_PEP_ID=MMETSP0797-20121207/26124_1 /TAXON_ID=47934 /ORGANISM="Dinophysis acuminata, Strain DAEP01" /LENGTH=449 /DNA_ID=CAMNT_0020968087 /DNA_START=59 /DNA_END=1408 /DNA_ORIENTATION=-
MARPVFALFWLACPGHGRGAKATSEQMQEASHAAHDDSQKAGAITPNSHSLAELKQLEHNAFVVQMASAQAGLAFVPAMLPVSHRASASSLVAKLDVAAFASNPAVPRIRTGGFLQATKGPEARPAVPCTLPKGRAPASVMQMTDPFRDPAIPGYVAPAHKVTWAPFKYAPPSVREASVREHMSSLKTLPPMPWMNVVLIGGVASGKGTLAGMIRQAFRTRAIGIGEILRAEAHTEFGRAAAEVMARGELLPDECVLRLLQGCVAGTSDCDGADVPHPMGYTTAGAEMRTAAELAHQTRTQNGWLFDGFPRTSAQAEALFSEEFRDLRPDAVILVERPDELVKEFALGRCFDTDTGQTYHPVYAPPPKDITKRLVWRLDDTEATVERRIAGQKETTKDILEVFTASGVPLLVVDNARSELETFGEIFAFIKETGMQKLSRRLALERVLV